LLGQQTEEVKFGLIYSSQKDELQLLNMTRQIGALDSHLIIVKNQDLVSGSLPHSYYIETDRIFSLKKQLIISKIGRINLYKIDEILRQMTLNIVEKHYNLIHKKDEGFIPGKTYIRYAGRVYNAEEIKTLVDSSLDFWLTAGKFAKQFEKELAKYLRVKHCILTNSGSSANLLAISALTSSKLGKRRLKPGDEVITTACAFPTTVSPIIQNNLVPVFLDVEIGSYNIQSDKIENALSEKTKAIFLAHTLGNPFNINQILNICKKYNLWLIEDNCDALGSKYLDKYTGTFGHIATFSFYPPHHITMGEGGALVTNDGELKKIISSFRDWGRDCWCEPGKDNSCGKRFSWQFGTLPYGYDHKYIYSHPGYNLKITDMQAAIGVAQLKKLPSFIKIRKENFKLLYDGFKKYEKYFYLPKKVSEAGPSWFGFLLTLKEDVGFTRNELVKYLEDHKIATRMLFSGNIIRQPLFTDNKIKYRVFGNLENTDKIMNDTFWLGVWPGIGEVEINYILKCFEKFINRKKDR